MFSWKRITDAIIGGWIEALAVATPVSIPAWLKRNQPQWADPALYALVGGSAVLLVILMRRLLLRFPKPRVYLTVENAESAIRDALLTRGFGVQRKDDRSSKFNYQVNLSDGKVIHVLQKVDRPRSLAFISSVGLDDAVRERMSKDQGKTETFIQDVCISLAIAGTTYEVVDKPPTRIVVSKAIPITDALTEHEWMGCLAEVG